MSASMLAGLVASELPRQFGVDAVGAVSTANWRRGGLACLVILGVAFAMLNLARDAMLIVRGRGSGRDRIADRHDDRFP